MNIRTAMFQIHKKCLGYLASKEKKRTYGLAMVDMKP